MLYYKLFKKILVVKKSSILSAQRIQLTAPQKSYWFLLG